MARHVHELERVTDAEWHALPPDGGRSIAAILEHVGWAKWMYDDYAFREGTVRGDRPPVWPADGQPRARGELDAERSTNWGERWPTRRILQTLIAHDAYHAGEINHLRALLQRNDRFPYGP